METYSRGRRQQNGRIMVSHVAIVACTIVPKPLREQTTVVLIKSATEIQTLTPECVILYFMNKSMITKTDLFCDEN